MANIKELSARRNRVKRQRVLKQLTDDGALPKPEERMKPFYDEQPDIM